MLKYEDKQLNNCSSSVCVNGVSCTADIAHGHIEISMMKRYIVQQYTIKKCSSVSQSDAFKLFQVQNSKTQKSSKSSYLGSCNQQTMETSWQLID